MGGPGAEWQAVRRPLTSQPKLISYDRPATGTSPGRPAPNRPLSCSAFAAELGTMLDQLGVTEPVIAVGHSFGSLIVRMFAAHHPERVAGMVHVDGSVPRLTLWPGSDGTTDGDGPNATEIDAVAGEAEIIRAALPLVPGIVLTRIPGRCCWSWRSSRPVKIT
jgi:pimeloyl-ACP methyl ester carboxylesterase